MRNETFKKVFLGVGGAAAGANVAAIVAGAVSPVVPIVGAIVFGGLALAAANADERTPETAAPPAS